MPNHVILQTRSNDGLTSGQIGAMAGSIIGFTVIVLLTIFCCINRGRQRYSYDVEKHHRKRPKGQDMEPKPPLQHPLMARVRWSQREMYEGHGRIPGGPKFPTYRALPIPNPRKPPQVRRTNGEYYYGEYVH